MNTTLIIFSKDRTLQLKSLLLSLRENYPIPEKNINVIYKNTIDEISYEPLMKEFKCSFIKQGDFLQDIKNIVKNANTEYFQFMVDDLIFTNMVDPQFIERFMLENPDVDSFCFRMGKNIKCGTLPCFDAHDDGVLIWNTSKQYGKHWNYAWEVASSLYRKHILSEYLMKCRHHRETFPNPFEDHFYSCMPSTKNLPFIVKFVNALRFFFRKKYMRIACFEKSVCFTQGVNLVADIEDDREQQYDPITLHNKMMDGYIIDFKSLKNIYPEQPNAGHSYFKLVKRV
jgi:hypothetical protein